MPAFAVPSGGSRVNVGDRFAARWNAPHLLNCTIVAFERDHVLADVEHRCRMACYVWEFRNTMPMDGRRKLPYEEFGDLWLPMNAEAVALPGSVTAERSYELVKATKTVRVRYTTGWRGMVQAVREQQGGRA